MLGRNGHDVEDLVTLKATEQEALNSTNFSAGDCKNLASSRWASNYHGSTRQVYSIKNGHPVYILDDAINSASAKAPTCKSDLVPDHRKLQECHGF